MKELTEKQADEMIARRAKSVLLGNVVFWQTSVDVFREITEKYPAATHIRSYQAEEKDGSVTLVHYPIDSDGAPCGPPINDTRPCPPLWE